MKLGPHFPSRQSSLGPWYLSVSGSVVRRYRRFSSLSLPKPILFSWIFAATSRASYWYISEVIRSHTGVFYFSLLLFQKCSLFLFESEKKVLGSRCSSRSVIVTDILLLLCKGDSIGLLWQTGILLLASKKEYSTKTQKASKGTHRSRGIPLDHHWCHWGDLPQQRSSGRSAYRDAGRAHRYHKGATWRSA